MEETFGVFHEGKQINFYTRSFPGSVKMMIEALKDYGLKRAISPEIASLIYSAHQNPEKEFASRLISFMNDYSIIEFTGNYLLPKSKEEFNNGVILEHNPKIKNGKLIMDKNSLIKRLQKNDPLVKFVPFGYKTGQQTPEELEKNTYVIARYGKEGAEKIAEVASKYKKNPSLYAFYFGVLPEEEALLSHIYVDRGLGLVISCYCCDVLDEDIRTFGIVP